MTGPEQESEELQKADSKNYLSKRQWEGKHENELNHLGELNYDSIYNSAVTCFKTGHIGINLFNTSIKALGLEDTKSLYVEQYVHYLNGYTILSCVNHIKQAVRKELLNSVNITLKDKYLKHYESLSELYNEIPFDGIHYSVCKMLLEGYSDPQVRYFLGLSRQSLTRIYEEMTIYLMDHGYCARRKHLVELIGLRYGVKFS